MLPESDAPVANPDYRADEDSFLALYQECHNFDKWLRTEAARSKLEAISEHVRSCIDAINEAYEKASKKGSTKEDATAYFQGILGREETNQLHDEIDRIIEACPELEKEAERVRLYITGLASHAGG